MFRPFALRGFGMRDRRVTAVLKLNVTLVTAMTVWVAKCRTRGHWEAPYAVAMTTTSGRQLQVRHVPGRRCPPDPGQVN